MKNGLPVNNKPFKYEGSTFVLWQSYRVRPLAGCRKKLSPIAIWYLVL